MATPVPEMTINLSITVLNAGGMTTLVLKMMLGCRGMIALIFKITRGGEGATAPVLKVTLGDRGMIALVSDMTQEVWRMIVQDPEITPIFRRRTVSEMKRTVDNSGFIIPLGTNNTARGT